ncbi:hypothetical protein B0T21DRAFT_409165 [Apiosordaria backusii]|uniref:Uncharacterized protein n=1 Tax=Apiosordaria backusii TaxID=314023 RepID=A0AA40EN17_9PEZI|nr:hypothetical protein B0T21DRAFT_409165 [Apiosordaria backusii]
MSQNTFHQFIKFSTDAYGLERTLRFLQSLTQLMLSYPTLPLTLLPFLGFPPSHLPKSLSPSKKHTLSELKSRLSLGRRYFRSFRFLENFSQAFDKYIEASASASAKASSSVKSSTSAKNKAKAGGLAVGLILGGIGLEKWLEILSKGFNGVYYCAETSTFIDELKVDGLGVWGRDLAKRVMKEENRMWFFSLVLGVLAGCWKVGRLGGEIAQARREVRLLEKEVRRENKAGGVVRGQQGGWEGKPMRQGEGGQLQQQQQQWREEEMRLERVRAGEVKLEEMRTRLDKLVDTRYKAARRAVADLLDLAVPGKAVGWVPLSTGVVSALMLGSTWLTGLEVWEKCGESVAKSAAKGEAEAKAKPKSE